MRSPAADDPRAPFRLVMLALGAAVVIHSLVTFGMFRNAFFWYLSATFIYWTLVLPLVAYGPLERRGLSYSTGCGVGVVIGLALVGTWWLRADPDRLATTRYEVARWMTETLEEDAIVGSFNAGQLGYFTDRPVVNLDGLINHVSYFETVIRPESPAALADYLDRVGVDYVVDYTFGPWRDVIEQKFATVREFDLGDGGAIKVMRKRGKTSTPVEPALGT
jgi:hypothetical protein